ncbi:hypothetical protein [Burkholderia contaminans]|uniref:Uncharacterized protein n=1 Tax=Burkholderia contaminans TaxID=488447 RepID=A0A3N8QQM3_9BURK|nr:hypothetical protein [Burkholderia contaminans]RQT26127.1 hypothetical protein DF037_20780 [Burkholderia contaminans]
MDNYRRQLELKKLDRRALGGRQDFVQEIDAGTHSDIARVVVRIKGDKEDYAPGIELAKRIVALPKLIGALRSISDALEEGSASIFDAMTAAREALTAAGIER